MNKTNHPLAFIPYPSYKDSGVQWLGDMPKHWEMRKTKYLFKERVQKGFPNEPLLAATQTKGVVPKTHYENRTVIAQKDLHLLKLVKKGDFVISLRSFQGGIELAYYQGIISPAYTIMNPKKEISGGYFKHLAKSKLFIKLLTTCVTGIREGQNIDYEILKRNRIPIPTPGEQLAIARFLDYKTAQIARFIKAKKRMIELLKEQKQVIVNDAVTGKIDVATGKPYRQYKNSGVEWLGQVPDRWEVLPLRWHILIGSGEFRSGNLIRTEKSPDYQYPVIGGNGVLGYTNSNNSKDNLIVIGRVGALCGNVHYVKEVAWITDNALRIDNIRKIQPEFLALQLKAMNLNKLSNANAQPLITGGIIKSQKVVSLPLNEQLEILKYIETKTTALALTISRTEREIALMQEYRTRLISDVVTGKIDVRAIEIPDIDDIIKEPIGEPEGEEELETAEAEE